MYHFQANLKKYMPQPCLKCKGHHFTHIFSDLQLLNNIEITEMQKNVKPIIAEALNHYHSFEFGKLISFSLRKFIPTVSCKIKRLPPTNSCTQFKTTHSTFFTALLQFLFSNFTRFLHVPALSWRSCRRCQHMVVNKRFLSCCDSTSTSTTEECRWGE